jgi:ATP-dependent DNA helicase RecG
MMTFFNMKHRETFMKNYIHQLIEDGILSMTIPDKPRSSKQRYVTTPAGIKQLEELH